MPMKLPHVGRNAAGRLSLTQQVALLSLVPVIALGFVLAHVLQSQIVSRTLADADQSAQLIARLGIQPRLTPRDLKDGLSARGVHELDEQLRARSVVNDLARIKIWNAADRVIYSDDHSLIGRTLTPSDDLEHALEGRPNDATVVTPTRYSETASEVGLGRLVEVYVPLRFGSTGGRPAGAFEIYLSYAPLAKALGSDKRTIALLVAVGLALLWALLFRIVARASLRLRRQAKENYFLARHDQLTGLPNRTQFIEGVGEALRREPHHRGAAAVLLVDLDGFREINDTLGHQIGDHVLAEVGRRLRAELPGEVLVARLGGDEYAVLCPHTGGVSEALATAAAIQSKLEAPIVHDSVALNIEASIGVAVMREHAEDLDSLLQRADTALERAKSHRSRVEVYEPEYDGFDASRLILLGQVRRALQRDEFVLHYQPEVDLASRQLMSVEALLRWDHPERGLLSPLQFIPLIEQTALIGPVTLHVIDSALRQIVAWRELGLHFGLSVNLSARNLLDPALPDQIAGLLREHGVSAPQLTVEVTESATLADPERAVAVLQALRASGIGVSVDDFGTGQASIAYLTGLPATEIKIDRSFIADVCTDKRADAIVRSIIDLSRHLDLRVVAEGIETEAVLERVAELGCDAGQGYLLSRPLPAEALTARLATGFGGAGTELRPVSASGPFVPASAASAAS
jgi:diguanylate cyclase (GGDEF)-like protein